MKFPWLFLFERKKGEKRIKGKKEEMNKKTKGEEKKFEESD